MGDTVLFNEKGPNEWNVSYSILSVEGNHIKLLVNDSVQSEFVVIEQTESYVALKELREGDDMGSVILYADFSNVSFKDAFSSDSKASAVPPAVKKAAKMVISILGLDSGNKCSCKGKKSHAIETLFCIWAGGSPAEIHSPTECSFVCNRD